MRNFRAFWVVILIGQATLAAEPPTTQPARGDTLVVSAIVNAPAGEIFEHFRTAEGIVRAWGVAKAKVDFRVGGEIRTSYQPETDLDSPKAIVNTILAYEPGRVLVIKPTAPEGSPDWLQAICAVGSNVLRLEPVAPDRTRVVLTGMGYGEGPLFDKAWMFFKAGNEATLKLMQKRLGRPDAAERSARAMALMRSRLGPGGAPAVWEAELPPRGDGPALVSRGVWSSAFDGKFVRVEGSIAPRGETRPHALFVCGTDVETGAVFYRQFMDNGRVAHGHFAPVEGEPDTLAADFNYADPTGPHAWHMRFTFTDADRYVMRLWQKPSAEGEPVLELEFRRVEAP